MIVYVTIDLYNTEKCFITSKDLVLFLTVLAFTKSC